MDATGAEVKHANVGALEASVSNRSAPPDKKDVRVTRCLDVMDVNGNLKKPVRISARMAAV